MSTLQRRVDNLERISPAPDFLADPTGPAWRSAVAEGEALVRAYHTAQGRSLSEATEARIRQLRERADLPR